MTASMLSTILGVVFAEGTAENTWPYVIASWLIVFGAIATYAAITVIRGRRLSRRVPPENRRWS